LRVSILPNAKRGVLVVGPDKAEFKLQLGHIEPPTEIRGVQARLNNLGFECPVNGKIDDDTRRALSAFQRSCQIEQTGEIDAATRQKLDALHDNVCDLPDRSEAETETSAEAKTVPDPEPEFEPTAADKTSGETGAETASGDRTPAGTEEKDAA
jgi:peptidoglycan hydrolase-like protein with peptidoglycan-binding domain